MSKKHGHNVSVADLLPVLKSKADTLSGDRKRYVSQGKEWPQALQNELDLIRNIIYKLERYGNLVERCQKAEKVAESITDERREWLQRLCVLSIDMRELSQEVRHAGIAKQFPEKSSVLIPDGEHQP